MNEFDEWMPVKKSLDEKRRRLPFVTESDIWWISIGKNVGHEINGKGSLFSRPAIIYKRLARGWYLVIPLTTKPHAGNWYVPVQSAGRRAYACIHQVRSIDYRRLSARLGRLSPKDYKRLKERFASTCI